MPVPVVVIHKGYKDYVKICLDIISKNNKVFIIGDGSLKRLASNNITYINIDKYLSKDRIKSLEKNFTNYSSNPKDFELFCFIRVLIIEQFMEEYNLESVFHSDSDNILIYNINNILETDKISYHTNQNFVNKMRMSNSIHSSIITKKFCQEFWNLCETIYIKKDISLIKDKIDYHKNIHGGICDMTFYYLLQDTKKIDVIDLNKPIKGKVFINNFNCSDGWESKNQYEMENGHIKLYKGNRIYDKIGKKYLQLSNIHFQGGSKKMLNNKWIKENLSTGIDKYGTDYGGWYLPLNTILDKDSIVYSGGVGEDISFDLILSDLFDANIYLIDPTKRSNDHFKQMKGFYRSGKKMSIFNGDIQKDYEKEITNLNPNFEKIKYVESGLWDEKKELKFFKPKNPKYVSHTLIEGMYSADYVLVPVMSVKDIMSEKSHLKIDLLKLDIEGAEVKVLNKMLDDEIYPIYILVEFDFLDKTGDKDGVTQKLIDRLLIKYELIVKDNCNFVFRIKNDSKSID